ncbi:MAG: KfrA protein [Pseudomonas sp.]|jgi:competence protein ComGC|nr:KfrA protein [Pseudomonas sp.]MBB51170.1 KfrA protein [Pseudomonadales bacterium]|tara:strand:+ start:10182 stop:11111 length:930 start_codon:yes stop_codon:yes gene_type:complete
MMTLSTEIRDRIYTAADELYEQGGKESFPTVDAVRKAARVSMNDCSTGMKDWRRAQTVRAAPLSVQVPEAVQLMSGQALAQLWNHAQELANSSLRAAEAAWEGERGELEVMRSELATAYELQAGELESSLAGLESAKEVERAQAQFVENMEAALASANEAAVDAEQKAAESKRLARELRAELDRAHTNADLLREERDRAAKLVREADESAKAQEKTLAELRIAMAASDRATALAEQRAEEVERRALELRTELDRAHLDADRIRQERDHAVSLVKAAEEARDVARQELASVHEEIVFLRAEARAPETIDS